MSCMDDSIPADAARIEVHVGAGASAMTVHLVDGGPGQLGSPPA